MLIYRHYFPLAPERKVGKLKFLFGVLHFSISLSLLENVLLREKLDFDDFLPARRMVSTKISEDVITDW